MQTIHGDVLDRIRIADVLDIAIIAILLYAVFIWFRNRTSRTLGLASVGLAILFFLARWLDLYLTTMVFHYGLIGILLAMVVIFQHDIRHGFERLASARPFHRAANAPPGLQIDTIIEAVVEMAQKRIGALIVFPGREPLDRHILGGVLVDGKISEPLLLSIFHPKSPGHDGAVLIEKNRIRCLGLHLPLTTQVDKVHDNGTRHAAALGLAECSDALIVVVSEERGTITVAQDGELQIVEPTGLADRLHRIFDSPGDFRDSRHNNRLFLWTARCAAIAAATALWFVFAYHPDTLQRTYVIPIEYRNLPADLELESPSPTYAEATLSGPKPAFALLDPATIAVSLEITETEGKSVFRWPTASNLTNIPEELVVENIVPESVIVSVRPKPIRPADQQ